MKFDEPHLRLNNGSMVNILIRSDSDLRGKIQDHLIGQRPEGDFVHIILGVI